MLNRKFLNFNEPVSYYKEFEFHFNPSCKTSQYKKKDRTTLKEEVCGLLSDSGFSVEDSESKALDSIVILKNDKNFWGMIRYNRLFCYANSEEFDSICNILMNSPYILHLDISCKALYDFSDEEYISILDSNKSAIIEWLEETRKETDTPCLHGDIFSRLFKIPRFSDHLKEDRFSESVDCKYVNNLEKELFEDSKK